MTRYIFTDSYRRFEYCAIWPDFEEQLQAACEKTFTPGGQIFVQTGDGSRIRINSDDIMTSEDYNPHGWNTFPDVIPPEGVHMRCECSGKRGTYCFAAYYRQGNWRPLMGNKDLTPERFRPWDDEENKE